MDGIPKRNVAFRIDQEDYNYMKERCAHAGYESNLSLYIRSILSKHLIDTHKAYEKSAGANRESIIDRAVKEAQNKQK